MNKFRFHVCALPHTQTTLAYTACAFIERVRKFCLMMKTVLGHAGKYQKHFERLATLWGDGWYAKEGMKAA